MSHRHERVVLCWFLNTVKVSIICSSRCHQSPVKRNVLPLLLAFSPDTFKKSNITWQNVTWAPQSAQINVKNKIKAAILFFQDFADSIFHLVREKYRSLVGGCSPAHARHKSLAGIVMTRGMANFIDFYIWLWIIEVAQYRQSDSVCGGERDGEGAKRHGENEGGDGGKDI